MHDVTVVRPSFSMTLVFRPTRWTALFDLFMSRLAHDPMFVAPLPARRGDGHLAVKLESLLGERIELAVRTLKAISTSDLVAEAARAAVVAEAPSPDPHLEALQQVDGIDLDTLLFRRPGVPVDLRQVAESVQLAFSGGYFLRMHAAAAPALRSVLRTDGPFRVAELKGELSAEAKVALARRLVVAGLLGFFEEGSSKEAHNE